MPHTSCGGHSILVAHVGTAWQDTRCHILHDLGHCTACFCAATDDTAAMVRSYILNASCDQLGMVFQLMSASHYSRSECHSQARSCQLMFTHKQPHMHAHLTSLATGPSYWSCRQIDVRGISTELQLNVSVVHCVLALGCCFMLKVNNEHKT